MTGRREPREALEMGAFMRRTARAMTRRAAAGEVDALTELVRLRAEVDQQIEASGRALVAFGYSLGEIGRELGITRQAAHQRFGGTTEREHTA